MDCCLWLTLWCFTMPAAYGTLFSNSWAVHIEGGERVARSVADSTGFTYVHEIMEDHYHFKHAQVQKRSVDASSHHSKLSLHSQVRWVAQQEIKSRKKRDLFAFNDEKYRQQWYLRDQSNKLGITMNVQGAWRKGYTGKGIVVSILDDGIEKSHPDLVLNYDTEASYDINNNDDDPTPRYDFTNENRHGTRCAGEVAAMANNTVCGVGVAYETSIGGIRMLDGDVTDTVEATALSRRRNHIDIYSASWGPDDDGKTVDGPATLTRKAFVDGVTRGRQGKGSIFVWASGNGGSYYDNCNCDGYTNSIYTLSVSSATERGNVPWYSEACSSTLVSTFSSGDHDERQITTTDLRHGCTSLHTGTSASAPLAAGIVALTLQANPGLTWRDVQYIAVLAASPDGLNTGDWVTNGVGRKVSHHFGFGIMNAEKMVDLAVNWTNIPEQHTCEVASPDTDMLISPKETRVLRLTTAGCQGSNREVKYIEHVQAKITLSSSWRGDIQMWLTSPSGTRSNLLTSRVHDDSRTGFNEWGFLSTHSWGEESTGEWTLEISNGYRAGKRAKLTRWSLVLYGTETDPLKPQPSVATTAPPIMTDINPRTEADVDRRRDHTLSTHSLVPTAPTTPSSPTVEESIINVIAEVHTPPEDKAFDEWVPEETLRNSIDRVRINEPRCPLDAYYLKDQCVDQCPSGYYKARRGRLSLECKPCHHSCAECTEARNYSCSECYFGYRLHRGQCISMELRTAAARTEPKKSSLSPVAVRSIVYGGISTVAVLLIILVSLLVYYKLHQSRTKQRRAVVTTLTAYTPVNPAEILASSQHSSQQELMDSDGEVSSQGRTSQTSMVDYRYNAIPKYPPQPV